MRDTSDSRTLPLFAEPAARPLVMEGFVTHHMVDEYRDDFYDQCREAADMDAPSCFPRGSAFFRPSAVMGSPYTYDDGFCGNRDRAGTAFA